MTERERLIELLKVDNCPSPMFCDANCKYAKLQRCFEERLADYLLENGVVVTDPKRNVPMCGTTNLPCCYCAPACGERRE